MIEKTLSDEKTQRFYDLWGANYDLFTFFEARAKARAVQLLALAPGQRVLEVGVGTGIELAAFQQAVQPDGSAWGVDLSARMALVAHQKRGLPIARADGRALPFGDQTFDRLYAAYVLDLIPAADLEPMLAGFHRVLRPGGLAVVVALTEGINLPSNLFVGLWKAMYALSPLSCGGCRPLQLYSLAQQAGFSTIEREVVLQFGVPSEILVIHR
ncbi:MAG TPA: methyltransferase domain-containing protein [Anaerolineales bacterium]|nr:methyltransferase domain-containing protein [Anaerolineales bacterium]